MAAFRLTPSAEEHIGEIVDFIATDNEDAAVRVRHALYSAFDLLASRPGIGHARDDPLTIVAVLHGARDVAQILKEFG